MSERDYDELKNCAAKATHRFQLLVQLNEGRELAVQSYTFMLSCIEENHPREAAIWAGRLVREMKRLHRIWGVSLWEEPHE